METCKLPYSCSTYIRVSDLLLNSDSVARKDRQSTTKCRLQPFSQYRENVAKKFIRNLKKKFPQFTIEPKIIGSVGLQISGRNEIDISIHIEDENLDTEENLWAIYTTAFKDVFGTPLIEKDNCIMFQTKYNKVQIEIFFKRGFALMVEKLLSKAFKKKEILDEYITLKTLNHNKRTEKQYAKDKFDLFLTILEKM